MDDSLIGNKYPDPTVSVWHGVVTGRHTLARGI